MEILSLFDGIACGMVAFERAGANIKNYYAYEIDKYAIEIAKKNYPNIVECGDVFDADFSIYKDAEVEWNYPLDYAIAFEKAIEALNIVKTLKKKKQVSGADEKNNK